MSLWEVIFQYVQQALFQITMRNLITHSDSINILKKMSSQTVITIKRNLTIDSLKFFEPTFRFSLLLYSYVKTLDNHDLL